MPIKKNPYGVGYSGDNYVLQDARCRCCEMPFRAKVYAMHGVPLHCEDCEDHTQTAGESLGEENTRLKRHEVVYRQRLDSIRVKMDELYAEVKDLRQKTKSALNTRDKWRDILTEVRALHEETADGKWCNCGVSWPCETRRILDLDPGRSEEMSTRAYQDLVKKERPSSPF